MGRPSLVQRSNGINGSNVYGTTLGYGYTNDGLLNSMSLPGGTSMSWGFDGLRRSVRNSLSRGSDSVVFVNDVQRDASGLTSKLTFGNGTQLRYSYETDRPLVKGIQAFRPNGVTPTWNLGLRYGNTGDIERMDRPNGERGMYNYDVLHRLVGVSYNSGAHLNDLNYRYHYDNNGNRVAFQHEFGVDTVLYAQPNNQPTTHTSPATGTRRFTYDHKGNRVSTKTYASSTDADTAWTKSEQHIYDWDDKLMGYVRIEKRADGGLDTIQRRYLLDERGWRIAELALKKGTSGISANDWEAVRKWVYHGNYAIADSGEAGWTWYGRIGEQPIASAHLDSVTHKLSGRWWLTDHLGSVTRVENDSGRVVEAISLDPYGNLESERGSEQVALTFTGKPRDGVMDCSDHGARCLDNKLGMWLGRDKKNTFESPYVYAGNFSSANQMLDPDGNGPQGAEAGAVVGEIIEPAGGGVPGAIIGSAIQDAPIILNEVEAALPKVEDACLEGAAKVAEAGTKVKDQVVDVTKMVLGKYPEYVNKAKDMGAKAFSIPSKIWDAMSPAAQQLANSKSIDRVAQRGGEFFLSNNPKDASGAYAWELRMMMERFGLIPNEAGDKLIKP